jgi:pimeloyl-ACP methyl ester carboxylesterase
VEARATAAFGSRQPVHVVGHSFGGAVALSLARLRPERVLSLTLFEPVCMSLLEPGAPYAYVMRLIADRVADLVQAGDLSEAARLFIDYWGGAGSYDGHDAEARQRFDRAVRKVPLDYAALRGGPASAAWYAQIAAPTQLMVGGASLESARSIAKALWAAIPGATLVELPGDHLMPMHNAAPVNREIARFLQSVEDATPLRRTGT